MGLEEALLGYDSGPSLGFLFARRGTARLLCDAFIISATFWPIFQSEDAPQTKPVLARLGLPL
jgi:hypothetical protein